MLLGFVSPRYESKALCQKEGTLRFSLHFVPAFPLPYHVYFIPKGSCSTMPCLRVWLVSISLT